MLTVLHIIHCRPPALKIVQMKKFHQRRRSCLSTRIDNTLLEALSAAGEMKSNIIAIVWTSAPSLHIVTQSSPGHPIPTTFNFIPPHSITSCHFTWFHKLMKYDNLARGFKTAATQLKCRYNVLARFQCEHESHTSDKWTVRDNEKNIIIHTALVPRSLTTFPR